MSLCDRYDRVRLRHGAATSSLLCEDPADCAGILLKASSHCQHQAKQAPPSTYHASSAPTAGDWILSSASQTTRLVSVSL
jgi:hypothetical protein